MIQVYSTAVTSTNNQIISWATTAIQRGTTATLAADGQTINLNAPGVYEVTVNGYGTTTAAGTFGLRLNGDGAAISRAASSMTTDAGEVGNAAFSTLVCEHGGKEGGIMQKEMWVSILAHQLKGIMFHADAFGVACLHGYERLKMAHCKQEREESNTFMVTRCKSIECLGEIVDIPAVQRIAIPSTATEKDIAEMWLKWEMEMAELYSKAMIENPECKMWIELHKSATADIRYISRMHTSNNI